jgi:hypothetical protein
MIIPIILTLIVSSILLFLFRKEIKEWFKKNKKKVIAIGTGTAIIIGGLIYTFPIPEATASYYFNAWAEGEEEWNVEPQNMVNEEIDEFASTGEPAQVELCNGNTYTGGGIGVITGVEIRAYGYYEGGEGANLKLRPVFSGSDDGDDHQFVLPADAADWSSWFNITTDTNAPPSWTWVDVLELDCDVEADMEEGEIIVYCGNIQLKVTNTYYYANGDGSSGNPYQITNCSDLNATRLFLSSHFILMNNISLDACGVTGWNAGAGFIPIGETTDKFNGSFNGQNYTISNLYIDRNTLDGVGLFGRVDADVTLWDINLVDVDITGNAHTGSLVGTMYNNGTIYNCHATGVVVSDGDAIGGLVGYLDTDGILNNCSADVNVSSLNVEIGGLVGYNYRAEINNSFARGNVSSSTGVTGGFVGRNDGGINNSFSTGNVSGADSDRGGFCGNNTGGTITNSYWDNETSNQTTSNGGTGRTTAQMTYNYVGYDPPEVGLYEDWDLADFSGGAENSIWVHDKSGNNNDGYPCFRWLSDGISPWSNTAPVNSNPNPTNGSTGVAVPPANFSIRVSDVDESNQSINLTFRTNASGTWKDCQTNQSNIINDTYYCLNDTWVTAYSTKYWWSVNTSDNSSVRGWDNDTYYFTTEAAPGGLYIFNTTIRTTGIDYFTWLGGNLSANEVADAIDNESEIIWSTDEYVAIWTPVTWNNNWSVNGSWQEYHPHNNSGVNFSISTLNVVRVYTTDNNGNCTFNMTQNSPFSYNNSKNNTLSNITNNKGFNYTSANKIASTNLSNINASIGLSENYWVSLWNETEYEWDVYISHWEFINRKVHHWDVIETKVSTYGYWVT